MARHINEAAETEIKSWERLELKSYQDRGPGEGIWTVGWGHTGPDVGPNTVITHEEAEALFDADISIAEQCVEGNVKVELNDNQFGALCSFVFNVGVGAFESSTLLKMLNSSDYANVPTQLTRWNRAGGQVMNGLIRRRSAEIALWSTPSGAPPPTIAVATMQRSITPDAMPPTSVTKSKTMIGASAAGIGAVLTQGADALQGVVGLHPVMKYGFMGLTLGGVVFAMFGRLTLMNKEGV